MLFPVDRQLSGWTLGWLELMDDRKDVRVCPGLDVCVHGVSFK